MIEGLQTVQPITIMLRSELTGLRMIIVNVTGFLICRFTRLSLGVFCTIFPSLYGLSMMAFGHFSTPISIGIGVPIGVNFVVDLFNPNFYP